MAKQVEVILEGFAGQSLRRVYDESDVRGRNVEELVGNMLQQDWQGKDRVAYNGIVRKIQTASGSYLPQIAKGGAFLGDPVSFAPVRSVERVDNYIQRTDRPEDQIRISITPAHKTAY